METLVATVASQTEAATEDASGSDRRGLSLSLAVSYAFDDTLIRLAQDIRAAHRKTTAAVPTATALARMAGAGLFLDAHEQVIHGVLQSLSEHLQGNADDTPSTRPQRNCQSPPTDGCRKRSRGGENHTPSGGSATAERRNTDEEQDLRLLASRWLQRQLDVLGETPIELL